MKIETKFEVGQTVWSIRWLLPLIKCPACNEELIRIECPKCGTTGTAGTDTARKWEVDEHPITLTEIEIRVKNAGTRIECCGIDQHFYNENAVYASQEEAQAECDKRNQQQERDNA